MNLNELESLCQEVLDGTISGDRIALLESELLQNSESLKEYVKYARLQSSLELLSEPAIPLGKSSIISLDQILRQEKKNSLRIVVYATAAILMVSLLVMTLIGLDSSSALVFKLAPGTKYSVRHSAELKDLPKKLSLEKGSTLEITQGTVELTFKSGVKSILQAPANVTLLDDDLLYIQEGVGWFEIPSGEEGFTVNTSEFNIVDLGTVFGVVVKPEGYDEIHVIQGKVKASTLIHGKEVETLTGGEARQVDSHGRLASIPMKSDRFLDSLPESLPYLHWSFDEVEEGRFMVDGTSTEISLARARPRGASAKTLLNSGKFGNAVNIQTFSQELLTNHPGISGDKPRSLACWIKVSSGIEHEHRSSIVGWGDRQILRDSDLRWQLALIGNGKGGSILCLIGAGAHLGSTILNDDQWHHIATVWTPASKRGRAGKLTAYIDGEEEPLFADFNRLITPNTQTGSNASPISIGARMDGQSEIPGIAFRGCIDELFIIEGALSEKDVRKLMKTNLME